MKYIMKFCFCITPLYKGHEDLISIPNQQKNTLIPICKYKINE